MHCITNALFKFTFQHGVVTGNFRFQQLDSFIPFDELFSEVDQSLVKYLDGHRLVGQPRHVGRNVELPRDVHRQLWEKKWALIFTDNVLLETKMMAQTFKLPFSFDGFRQ